MRARSTAKDRPDRDGPSLVPACIVRRSWPRWSRPGTTRRGRGEDGQLVTGIVVLAAIFAVFAIGILLLPLGAVTTERSAAQAAADAAALAGAGELGSGIQDGLTGSFPDVDALLAALSSPAVSCVAGQPKAEEFAQRNGARVVTYCADWVTGTATATVQMTTTATSGAGAKARATASVGFDPSLCVAPTDPPTPPPSSPPPSSPSSPPPDGQFDIDCGPVTLHAVLDGGTGLIRLDPLSQLDTLFDPRLVR